MIDSSREKVRHVPSCHVIRKESPLVVLKAAFLLFNSVRPLGLVGWWSIDLAKASLLFLVQYLHLPVLNSKSQYQMADSNHVAQPGNHPSKAPPVLDPPKDDPISTAQLAECDGTLVPHVLPSGLTAETNTRTIKQEAPLLTPEI